MCDIRPGEKAFFCVRDPITRFVSGFYHRKQKLDRNVTERRVYNTWDKKEIQALERHSDINSLLSDLFSGDEGRRENALAHMSNIFHIGKFGSYWNWFVNADYLGERRDSIDIVLRQENFSEDMSELARRLGSGHVEMVRSRATDYGKSVPLEDRHRPRLASFLRREYEFIDALKDLKLLPPSYLVDEISLSKSGAERVDHFTAMKRYRPLQYSENRIVFASYHKFRRSVGRAISVAFNRSSLKKHIETSGV